MNGQTVFNTPVPRLLTRDSSKGSGSAAVRTLFAFAVLVLLATSWIPAAAAADPDCPPGLPVCNTDNNVVNGYWWFGYLIPGYVSLDSRWTPAPIYSVGGAVFYAPGVMRGTAYYRDMDLEGYVGGVALMSPADIGLPVWLRLPGGSWEGPFLVVDYATRRDLYPVIVIQEEVVEVDFDTAVRWGMAKRIRGGLGYKTLKARILGVEVAKVDPRLIRICGLDPVPYVDWFLDGLTWADHYSTLKNAEERAIRAANVPSADWLRLCRPDWYRNIRRVPLTLRGPVR